MNCCWLFLILDEEFVGIWVLFGGEWEAVGSLSWSHISNLFTTSLCIFTYVIMPKNSRKVMWLFRSVIFLLLRSYTSIYLVKYVFSWNIQYDISCSSGCPSLVIAQWISVCRRSSCTIYCKLPQIPVDLSLHLTVFVCLFQNVTSWKTFGWSYS